jgi:S1-C subfamily serine protease
MNKPIRNRLALIILTCMITLDARAAPLSNQEIYQLHRRSVLKIAVTCKLFDGSVEKRSGTGFLISASGHVITSYHLVGDPEDCESLELHGSVRNVGDPWVYDTTLQLLAIESNYDVSILKVTTPLLSEPIALRQLVQPQVLEDFVFLTYSLSPELAGTPSSVRGSQRTSLWQTNHAFNPGDSGAPIIDREGRAIGLVLGRVATADVGDGPIDIQSVGWMISTIPAINEIVAAASSQAEPVMLASAVAQPGFAVATVHIYLTPERMQVAQLCPALRACLPVDPDGAPVPSSFSKLIGAPMNSFIAGYQFEGTQRGGNVSLSLSENGKKGDLRAIVSGSDSAVVSGAVKVFFAPSLIQMAYPVDLKSAEAGAGNFKSEVSAEPGYRMVKAEFRPQSPNKLVKPRVQISNSRTSVEFSASVPPGPGAEGSLAAVHGMILTTQERIPGTTQPQ